MLLSIISFNPYFTGSNSGSVLQDPNNAKLVCFNPYFTGSNSGSKHIRLFYLYY